MKLAVISDVHGNFLALDAVLDDIRREGVDLTVNLGDHVSGPLDPVRAADTLMELGIPTIRGNHERWIVEGRAEAKGAIDSFAARKMQPRHLRWFEEMPATHVVDDTIFMCHGTPSDDTAPWLDNWWNARRTRLPSEAEVSGEAIGLDYPVLLCGHTHLARAVRLRDGRLIVNPGSVGLQMVHGSPDARYAVIERRYDEWHVSLKAVPYDHFGAARQAEANGFGHWAEALTTGWAEPEGLF